MRGQTKSTLSPVSYPVPIDPPPKPCSSSLICPEFLYANVSWYLNESFPFLSYFLKKPSQSFLLLKHFCVLESTGLWCSLPAFLAAGLATLPLLLHPGPVLVRASGGQVGAQGRHRLHASVPGKAPGQSGQAYPEGPGQWAEMCSHSPGLC